MYINKNTMCLLTNDGQLVCLNIPKMNNIAFVPQKIKDMKIKMISINKMISCILNEVGSI